MAVAEYEGGGQRGFVVILEGRGGRGWVGFVLKLRKVLETFQTSFGYGPIPCHSGVPLVGTLPLVEGAPYNTFDTGGVCVGRGRCPKVVCLGIGLTRAVYGGFHVSREGQR